MIIQNLHPRLIDWKPFARVHVTTTFSTALMYQTTTPRFKFIILNKSKFLWLSIFSRESLDIISKGMQKKSNNLALRTWTIVEAEHARHAQSAKERRSITSSNNQTTGSTADLSPMALEPGENAAKFVNFLKFWVCSWSLRDFAVIRLHCHLRCFLMFHFTKPLAPVWSSSVKKCSVCSTRWQPRHARSIRIYKLNVFKCITLDCTGTFTFTCGSPHLRITQAQYHKLSSLEAATITAPFSRAKLRHVPFSHQIKLYVSWCLRPHWNRAKHRQIGTSRATLFPPIFGAAHRADRFRRYAVSPPLYNQQLEVSVHIFDLRTHNFMSSIRKRCGKANPSKAAILYIDLCERLNKSQ